MHLLSKIFLALLFLLVCRPALFAHDALASFADLWLAPQTMELTITMARSAAFLLIADQNPGIDHVDTDTFAEARPKLLAQMPELCHLGKLTPDSLDVEMTEERDVCFRMVYLRPTAGGPVRFDFPYLQKMVEEHLLTLAVWRENKTGLKILEMRAAENPAVEILLPSVAPVVVVAPPLPIPSKVLLPRQTHGVPSWQIASGLALFASLGWLVKWASQKSKTR